jgi:hypothetical protein
MSDDSNIRPLFARKGRAPDHPLFVYLASTTVKLALGWINLTGDDPDEPELIPTVPDPLS